MADNTTVNLRSKYEDDEDQLNQLWSAIDLDEIMDEASNPSHFQENKPEETGRAKIAQLKKSRGPQQQQQRKGACNLFNTAKGCHFGEIQDAELAIAKLQTTDQLSKTHYSSRQLVQSGLRFPAVTMACTVHLFSLGIEHIFRLFTFLLDKNGQLNYNIDITEPKAWI